MLEDLQSQVINDLVLLYRELHCFLDKRGCLRYQVHVQDDTHIIYYIKLYNNGKKLNNQT
jgi:hypothetical protein